jgi:hypothetical protein
MSAMTDRGFHPRLESLEERNLLSGFRSIFTRSVVQSLNGAPAGGTGTAGAVRTIVNTFNLARFTVSVVPHNSSLGGFSHTSPATVPGFDPGLGVPGLPTAHGFGAGPGLTTPGLPSIAPSQPVTPPPLQPGGLALNPNGSVTGSLFM